MTKKALAAAIARQRITEATTRATLAARGFTRGDIQDVERTVERLVDATLAGDCGLAAVLEAALNLLIVSKVVIRAGEQQQRRGAPN
jgi:hypothetical protein